MSKADMTAVLVDAASAEPRSIARRPAKRPIGRPTRSNEQLLQIAIELFLSRGFDRTSLEAISQAAGMAKRTVYARYGNKQTLFRAALESVIDAWIVPVGKLRELETSDLEQTLLNIGDALVTNIMSPAGLRLFRLTNAMAERMPEIAAANVKRGTESTVAFLTDLLGRRVPARPDPALDMREAATAFIHLVVGGPSSMAAWGIPLDQSAVERHTRTSIDLFLHGLLQREQVDPAVADDNTRLRRLLTDALLENARLTEARDRPQEQ